jgi:hypothetical protein
VAVLRRGIPAGLSGVLAAALVAAGLTAVGGAQTAASAAGPPTLDLRVLLIGEGATDPTTAAWQAALTSEGVPFTLVTASGSAPSETVGLPALSSGSTGNYNGVVIADSPADYASGQLAALDAYESSFGVRQVDGYMFPSPALGVTDATGGALDGTTGTLTSAGLAAFPELKGPVPFDAGSYGYAATVDAGAPYTPFLTNAAGHVLAGVYQHPDGDPQAGVAELALNFDYNASQTQWLLLAPGLINWVTQDTHLGLYRNYFGEDIDDVFIADNEWSRQFQCTPAATDPPDYTCPPGVANNPADTPPDVQMSAADVAYVASWEQQTGIRLNLAFNGIGACSADTAADESSANCTGSVTDNGVTYTDPGQNVDPGSPNDGTFVNALLADQGDFNWITHTWSHLFLGCVVWQPQPLTSVTATGSGGSLAAGSYNYEITAATAYGESEPSAPQQVTVGQGGSVTLTWPEAGNGFSTDGGSAGPSLAQEEASHTGGTGFWGYHVYREDPGSGSYGLVGQVPENQSATSGTTYTFTDTGATTPGVAPNSGPDFPTATNPGIDCAGGTSSWLPASSTSPDSSIEQEIGLDQAFAAANGLTNYTPAAVVTGEHSGVENPNMPAALAATGVTTFAQDASRQPQQYSLGAALGAPRYPSNIYYNASNWPDELNEYNTLYVKQGVPLGDPGYPGDTGHCVDTADTTCISQPATEASLLASETHIMLSHVLANDPRVSYAHQSDLIGPATQNGQDYGYTILTLISSMLGQYNDWFTAAAPIDQVTDVSDARVLAEQGAWAAASGKVTATESGGTVAITNNGSDVSVPVTVPPGTTGSGGSAFGQAYGGTLSAWDDLGSGATQTLTESVAPVITSAATATSIVGSAFSFTVRASGAPVPAISESGALPAGITFTDNGDGTATIAGTPAAGSGGSYPILITASNSAGGVSDSFTLTNAQAPSIVSPSTATFTATVSGTYTVTTTGYPAATITETGALPGGLSFHDKGDGTATISGTAAAGSEGSYPVTVSATNVSGSTATLPLTIAVQAPAAPAITSGSIAFFTAGQAGAAAVTTTGSPVPAVTETGALPGGLSFHDNANGTALISGTASVTGTASLNIRASNGISPDATQAYSVIVGRSPSFTSASSVTATLGSAFSFTVRAGGYPAPSWGESNLPPGVSFTGNGDGTATLSGTPTTPGTYAMPLMATNAYGSAQQTLTVTVQQAPAITSGNAVNFTVGAPGSFSVQTTGSPAASITESGALPSGVSFTDNGDGTATLAGTPASGTSGSYPLTITAANGVSPAATQSFTVTVNPATPAPPAINSGGSAAFTVGAQGSFPVLTTGNPTASITESGALPSGVSFTDNGDGTATLAGTPASGTSGSYRLTITAANGVSPAATQSFTLTVSPATAAPVITSSGGATFAAGQSGSFTVTATGLPVPGLSATSSPALPSGVSFTDNGDGTATLAGSPPQGSQGTYLLTIKAASSSGTATQSFLLTINSGLAITSAATATAAAGSGFSFKVTTAGTPEPTLSRAGGLPAGVTFTDNGDGTGTLSGTPTAAGSFPLTFTARNATGTASQAFLLTVDKAPAFTSAATVKETAGMAFTAVVSAVGFPAPKLTASGLPAGVSFSDDGGGAGTLSGTAAVEPGTYPVTVTAANAAGTVTQTVTLSVKTAGSKAPVPAFTSAAAASAAAGQPADLTFTTAGSPTGYVTNITRNGALPAGLVFTNLANGTATLTGTPSASSGGSYPLTLSAQTAGGVTTQAFVLTVTADPAIVTGTSATATVGSGFSFTVQARGAPAPTLTETGALPQGLTWTDNGNGTATLAGAPGVAQGGVYKLTFTATSLYGTATQSFTLTVDQAPGVVSAPAATAAHGKPFSFTFTGTGYPVPGIGHTGSVPGLKFGSSSNGALTLSGTPTTPGNYSLVITAKNAIGSVSQAFTLTVS